MKAADGRTVKSGMLIRSGHLVPASVADIFKLGDLGISLIVDFRDAAEVTERPDPEVEGAQHLWLPALDNPVPMVSHDEDSDNQTDKFVKLINEDSDAGRKYLVSTYCGFIKNPFTVKQYTKFVDILLENNTGATLWHCTAGKDRAGFAAMIVEHILGVSDDDILEDYLMTNTYLEPEIENIFHMLKDKKLNINLPAYRYLFIAHEDYYEALHNSIDELYGSWDSFLLNGLGVDKKKAERFRKKFLD